METTITSARGDVLLRPSRREDATAYRDLRLDALQRSPAAFGADYASSAARPLSFWEERMAQGMIGEQGVTYLALSGDALIGMTSLVRNTLAKTQHSAAIFGVYLSPDLRCWPPVWPTGAPSGYGSYGWALSQPMPARSGSTSATASRSMASSARPCLLRASITMSC
jgi:RimJ/RimL family protein N-acetyltransferase